MNNLAANDVTQFPSVAFDELEQFVHAADRLGCPEISDLVLLSLDLSKRAAVIADFQWKGTDIA
jgi:hypothetical protein